MADSVVPFKNLPISTQTVMAYMNCTFNFDNILKILLVTAKKYKKNLKDVEGKNGDIYITEKKTVFRNQIPLKIFAVDKFIAVKIFRTGKFHLTGCKTKEHYYQASIMLLNKIRSMHTDEMPTFHMEDSDPFNIIFEVVMVNVDFHLGFVVNQKALDYLIHKMNQEFYTIYESTMNTSVNIKLDYPDPPEQQFHKIIVEGSPDEPILTHTTINKCEKSRKRDSRKHTFLVFSSSKVIQSGRYYETEMESAYKKFNELIEQNRYKIELKLKDSKFDINSLEGLKIPIKLNY